MCTNNRFDFLFGSIIHSFVADDLCYEGYFERGDNVLIIDDVSTSGNSIMDIANKLRSAGCIVKDALVLVDRMEGAIQNLKNNGIRLHYFATINELQPYIHNILEKEQK